MTLGSLWTIIISHFMYLQRAYGGTSEVIDILNNFREKLNPAKRVQ